MELKNALAVCLISLFSATLVVLIARTLDVRTESRLEPQLVKIVEQLEGIRQQAGIVGVVPSGPPTAVRMSEGLMVYYFHSNTRCPTCREIESQAYDVVHSDFAAELGAGKIEWKVLNYEEAANADLAKKFEIQVPMVVVARIENGELAEWKSLDRVWALVGDQAGCASYVQDEIRQQLLRLEPQPTVASSADNPAAAEATAEPDDLPVTVLGDLPIPE